MSFAPPFPSLAHSPCTLFSQMIFPCSNNRDHRVIVVIHENGFLREGDFALYWIEVNWRSLA